MGKCPTPPVVQALTLPIFPGKMGLRGGGSGDSHQETMATGEACLAWGHAYLFLFVRTSSRCISIFQAHQSRDGRLLSLS